MLLSGVCSQEWAGKVAHGLVDFLEQQDSVEGVLDQ